MTSRPEMLGEHGSVRGLGRWESFVAWFRLAAPKGNQIHVTGMLVFVLVSQVWFGRMEIGEMFKLLVVVGVVTVVGLAYKKWRLLKLFDRLTNEGLRLVVLRSSSDGHRYSYLVLKEGEVMEMNVDGRGLGRDPLGKTEFGLSPRGKVRTLTMGQQTWLARTP